MSVTSVQFTVAAHIMAALGYKHGEEISSATLAESVNADPTFVRKVALQALESGLGRSKAGQERSEHAFAFSATNHAARHMTRSFGASPDRITRHTKKRVVGSTGRRVPTHSRRPITFHQYLPAHGAPSTCITFL